MTLTREKIKELLLVIDKYKAPLMNADETKQLYRMALNC